MINQLLLDYIKQQLQQGMSREIISGNLISQGWQQQDLVEAFSALEINQAIPSSPSTIPIAPVKYAGFWIRYAAAMVDVLILIIPIGIVQFGIGLMLIKNNEITGIDLRFALDLISCLITWLYFVSMTYNKGATLGKMLVGITVKSDDLQKLSFGRVFFRETTDKLISGIILFIGYIMAGFTKNKQALHDKLAHSVVVYKEPIQVHRKGRIIAIIIASILPAIAILFFLVAIILASLSKALQLGQAAQNSTSSNIQTTQTQPSTSPIDLDLSLIQVPDSQNAFFILNTIAINEVNTTTMPFSDQLDYIQGKNSDLAAATKLINANKTVLDKFSQAVQKIYFQVPGYSDPKLITLSSQPPANVGENVDIVYLVEAITLAKQGKADDALAMVFNSLKLAHNIQQSQDGIIVYLMSTIMKDRSLEAIQTILPLIKSANTLKVFGSALNSIRITRPV